jgi:GGDEF domain-containing protein
VIVPRDAERFRADREQLTGLLTVRLGGQTDPTPVTSTVGLVELDPQLRRGFDEVLAEADAQMYLRKRARASAIPVQATPAGRGREA